MKKLLLIASLVLLPTWASAQSVSTTLSTTVCPGAGCIVLNVDRMGTAGIQITGTGSWTANFDVSVDGINYKDIKGAPSDGTASSATATAAGAWSLPVAGYVSLRVRLTSWSSGSPRVTLNAAPGGGGGSSGAVTVGDITLDAAGLATSAKQPALGTAGTASTDVITVQGIASGTAQPVTLTGTNTVATITNVVHVDDNSGSLTVDAPATTPLFVRLSTGSAAIDTIPISVATIPSHAVTNAGTFAVQVSGVATAANQVLELGYIDGLEALIGTSNTSLATIAAQTLALASTTSGSSAALVMGAVTTSAPTYVNATNNALSIDTAGSLRVTVVGGGGGGTSQADNASFTDNTSSFTPAGGVAEISSPTACAEGKFCAQGMTLARSAKVTLYTEAGVALTAAQDQTENTVFAGGIKGPAILTRRILTPTATAGTDAYYSMLNTSAVGALYTQPIAGTTGGASGLKYTSVGTTDKHAVKATAGTLYSITATNTNASARYIRCTNATTANTTVGSTTAVIDLAIPGATSGAGITFSFPVGFNFSTALSCWLVTGAASTDTTSVALDEIRILYSYL